MLEEEATEDARKEDFQMLSTTMLNTKVLQLNQNTSMLSMINLVSSMEESTKSHLIMFDK